MLGILSRNVPWKLPCLKQRKQLKKDAMSKGIFRWLVAGSLPRKWPGLLRFSLRDNRAWFCFIMSACFLNCETKKITNNPNHNQYTCPSSEAPLMNCGIPQGLQYWSPRCGKVSMLMPVGWIDTYHKSSRCAAEGSGVWGVMLAGRGGLFEEVVPILYVLLYIFLGSPLTCLILVCKHHLHSDSPSFHIQKPVM